MSEMRTRFVLQLVLGLFAASCQFAWAQSGPPPGAPPGGEGGAPPGMNPAGGAPGGMAEGGMPRLRKAPVDDGYFEVMTVDGVETPLDPGTYEGRIVIHDLSSESAAFYKNADNVYRSALFVEDGAIREERSALSNLKGGKYSASSLKDTVIRATSPYYNGVTVVDQKFAIDGVEADFSGDGGNDMEGTGSVLAAFGGAEVSITDSRIVTHGTGRSTVFAGSDDSHDPAVVRISDTTLIANGNNQVEPTSVWMLGLFGDVRGVQYVGYFDVSYDNVKLRSAGWAVLSVDDVGAPQPEDLQSAGISGAYDPDNGYGDLGPDDFMDLYYWSGSNHVKDSDFAILGIGDGGWGDGYGTYSIGANRVAFDNTHISNVSYGAIVANEYASVSFENGSVVDSNRYGVYSHSNAGGVINVENSTLNTQRPVFLLKSSDGMFGPNATMVDVTDSKLHNSGDGVILLFMDNDDPGGGSPVFAEDGTTRIDEMIQIVDKDAVRDVSHDVTRAIDYGEARFLYSGAGYMINLNPVAWFNDCRGDTALNGNFFNARTGSQNLVLHFNNSEVTGTISSGTSSHDVDVLLKSMTVSDADYEKDGIRYGNRNNLGEVSVEPTATVNNGVIVYLENGSEWTPEQTSYVARLVASADSAINGQVQAASTQHADDGSVTYLDAVVTGR